MQSQTGLKLSAGIASLAVAATLVALKLWALSQTQALSIAASLADSTLDLSNASRVQFGAGESVATILPFEMIATVSARSSASSM